MLDELRALQVFYINIGGGEPMIRRDFFELVDYATTNGIGVKFSTNGTFIDRRAAERLAAMDYLDVQISLDGVDAATNDAVRGDGSYARARAAMDHLAAAGFGPFKISVVVTRHNVDQLDAFKALADAYGAQLRVTRLRPSGRGADSWHDLHPTQDQQRTIYRLAARPRRRGAHRRQLLPPQRPRPGAARAQHVRRRARRLPHRPGRRRVRLPVRHPRPVPRRLGPRTRRIRRGVAGQRAVPASCASPPSAGACASCGSYDACQGGCMAAKFFTGMPLDGPDPECVEGHGEAVLAGVAAGAAPRPAADHSRPVQVAEPGHPTDWS